MKYLDKYIDHLKTLRRADATIKNHKKALKKAVQYFTKVKIIIEEKNITEKDIVAFMDYLNANNTPDYTYAVTLFYLNAYFKFLENENLIFLSPMTNIDIPKAVKRPSQYHSEETIIEILSKIKPDNDTGIRVKALLELLYSTSIRPGEARNLKTTDIDFKKQVVFIHLGKNKKDRVVPIGKNALYWLDKYIKEVRSKYLTDNSVGDLFISFHKTDKKLTYLGFTGIIREAIKKYTLPKFKPYSLRTSSATHLLKSGMGILHIKKLLGHNEIKTTKTYLHLDTWDLKNKMNESHPRNNLNNKEHEE